MPILAHNRALYPPDWPAIRARILARDENRCKWCGVENYAVGYRDAKGTWHRLAGNGPCDAAGVGHSWPNYQQLAYAEAREIADVQNDCVGHRDDEGHHWRVIVLTIAHLDHDPRNCADENLSALCQQCHNRYDRPHRNRTRRLGSEIGQMGLAVEYRE